MGKINKYKPKAAAAAPPPAVPQQAEQQQPQQPHSSGSGDAGSSGGWQTTGGQQQRSQQPQSSGSGDAGSLGGWQTAGSTQGGQGLGVESKSSQPPAPKPQPKLGSGTIPMQRAGIIKRGTIGKRGQVAVNYLDVNLDKMPKTAYQYDVKIEPERPKKFWRQAFEQFRFTQLGGAVAAYDGRASCFSVDKLNTGSSEVTVLDGHGRSLEYTVEVQETGDLEVDLNSLRNYMKDRVFEKPMRALQCLEVVLGSPCHGRAIRAGRSHFKMPEPGHRLNLGEGYEGLIGLYQALTLGDRPFLNVDIAHKSFPIGMTVMEYLENYGLRQRITSTTELSSDSIGHIEPFLKGLNIVYRAPDNFGLLPRVYRVNSLSPCPASTQTFEREGRVISIKDYFSDRNYDLRYPQLPLLSVGTKAKEIMLPIELCSIEAGQPLHRKDGATQVANMIKFAATSTNERKAKIMDMLRFFNHNLDPTISRFGIRIGTDFIVVESRLLNPPQVEYKDKKWCSVRNGSWCMGNMQFLEAKPKVHKWAILYCDPPSGYKMPYNQVAHFNDRVFSEANKLGVKLEERAEIRTYRNQRDLDNCFSALQGRCDLVVVIMHNKGVTYDTIKQMAELQYGILTQCINQVTIERKLTANTMANILLKVNGKLNGINHKLRDDARMPMLKNAMFLGADVSHPSPDQREIPSVVGVAASHDPFAAVYNMQYRLQQSTVEEIDDMEDITLAHLRIYRKYRNAYPEHIIYYRDGVSDGQFPKIKSKELRGIKAACIKVSIRPKICCIIVVKRHHTRFFPSGETSDRNKFNNVQPGTVVDRTIVHPNEMQFFMVSHQSVQGTARPTRYNIIENTGNLDIDLLQQLTFNLCHMFPRCNRSVSYPAPVYLAHLVAARGRVYLTGSHTFEDPKQEYEKRRIVSAFVKDNPMFFV